MENGLLFVILFFTYIYPTAWCPHGDCPQQVRPLPLVLLYSPLMFGQSVPYTNSILPGLISVALLMHKLILALAYQCAEESILWGNWYQ